MASIAISCVQAELEDEILQLLSSATGNLLDNIQLINTLNASKTTWEQVNQSLQVCYLASSKREHHCCMSQLGQHLCLQTVLHNFKLWPMAADGFLFRVRFQNRCLQSTLAQQC